MSAAKTLPDLEHCYALLLAGGASSRFFPLNKIFADLTGSGRSMIQQALDRVAGEAPEAGALVRLIDLSRVLVATSPGLVEEIRRQLPELPPENVVAEPEARGTLPAILWTLAHLRVREEEATVAVLTADHVIGELPLFRRQLALALARAQAGPTILTVGIEASDRPEDWTGFGALRAGDEFVGAPGVHRLLRFEEKPGLQRARRQIAEGGWRWNSGMFVFAAATLESALGDLRPEMGRSYRRLRDALAAGETEAAAEAFRRLPRSLPHPDEPGREVDNSVDYALMMPLVREPSGVEASLIPGAFPWVDLGSWTALREVVPAEEGGNVVLGEVSVADVQGSVLVAAPGRRIEARGLRDTIVVHAGDGRALVAASVRAQEVKELARLAAEEPETQGLFLDCRDCLLEPQGGRVAALGLRGLAVSLEDETLRVGPLPLSAGAASQGEALLEALATRPLALRPVVQHYAWGGSLLPAVLSRRPRDPSPPSAEAWLDSTHPRGPAGLVQAPMTLEELVREREEMVGPISPLLYGPGVPVFAKLLSTRFPPRVRLGFSRRVSPRELLSWLLREQELLRSLRNALEIPDEEAFLRYRELWEVWSTAAAGSSWREADSAEEGVLLARLADLLRAETVRRDLAGTVKALRENRARLVECLNRIDLTEEAGHLLLTPAGTLHGISGMSFQLHPADPGRSRLGSALSGSPELAPEAAAALSGELAALRGEGWEGSKEEAWIPVPVAGEILIVEVQQSSDTTLSVADFHTPFEWREGRLVFRKGSPETGIGEEELIRSLGTVDLEPRPVSSFRHRPASLPEPPGSTGAGLEVLIDDPRDCPYFRIHRLTLRGSRRQPARWLSASAPSAFLQLVVIDGSAELQAAEGRSLRVAPGAPAFIPSTCAGGFSLEARERTTLLLIEPPLGPALAGSPGAGKTR